MWPGVEVARRENCYRNVHRSRRSPQYLDIGSWQLAFSRAALLAYSLNISEAILFLLSRSSIVLLFKLFELFELFQNVQAAA